MAHEIFPILSWRFSHEEDTVRSVNGRPWYSYPEWPGQASLRR